MWNILFDFIALSTTMKSEILLVNVFPFSKVCQKTKYLRYNILYLLNDASKISVRFSEFSHDSF